MSQLEIAITTHHDLETETPASVVRWLQEFSDAEITIGQNDAREARVTIALHDEIAGLFDSGRNDYVYRLFVRYHGVPAIWAPVKTEWGERLTLIAKDIDRLEAHYLRDGDDAVDDPVTIDYWGLRLLADAAQNTTDQDARFVAPLGITDGSNTADASTDTVRFERGDQVWSSMQQLDVDFELEPYDVADSGAGLTYSYMKLNTFDAQGTDRTSSADAVVFHDGYGLNNALNMRAVPDRFVTHAHALAYGGKGRATAYHADSSRERGIYVHWKATQFEDFDALALPFVAESYVRWYGLPAHAWTLDLRPEALQEFVALAGYGIGDRITAGVKRGYFNREEQFEIRGMRLRQYGRSRQTVAELTLALPLVDPLDIGDTEE